MSDPVKNQLEEALKAEPVDDNHKELIAEVQKEWDEYQKKVAQIYLIPKIGMLSKLGTAETM